MRVRTLYLIKDEPPGVIAKTLGVDRQIIYDLVSKRGWAKMREKVWAKADAQITADLEQVSHAIATESEELTFGTLQMLRESIDQRDAKSAQMASGAARNLVDIARRSRGQDQQIQGGSTGGNMNFFVLQGVPQADKPARDPVNVTPATAEPVQIDATKVS